MMLIVPYIILKVSISEQVHTLTLALDLLEHSDGVSSARNVGRLIIRAILVLHGHGGVDVQCIINLTIVAPRLINAAATQTAGENKVVTHKFLLCSKTRTIFPTRTDDIKTLSIFVVKRSRIVARFG